MRVEFVMSIFAMAVATFATRFTSVGILTGVGIPACLERFLKHVPTAMLTALIAPALAAPQGFVELTFSNHYLLAGVIAAWVAWKGQPPIVTMGAGITAMLALRLISV